MTLYVILFLVAVCVGMAISISAFGTGGKRKNIFKDIYFSVEDTEDGIGVLYTKGGDYSATMLMENPVEQYSANIDAYYDYTSLFTALIQTLGEGYAIHKQDVFCMEKFRMEENNNKKEYLSDAYFNYFQGRPYTECRTYLTITQEGKKGRFNQYDAKKWNDFLIKLRKVIDQLHDGGVKARFLNKLELSDFVDRFFAVNFKRGKFSMSNYKVDEDCIHLGDRKMKIYSLVDVDQVSLPRIVRPYTELVVNNTSMSIDFMSHISYTKEHPITMNPFCIRKEELNVEKTDFLKNMVLLIWKGAQGNVSKEEDKVVNMVITEYYDVYFEGFAGFSDEQRWDMQRSLQIDMRCKEDDSEEARSTALRRLMQDESELTLEDMTLSEEEIYKKEQFKRWNSNIYDQIDNIEKRRKELEVSSLSFNSFYEYAMQRVPDICKENKIEFDFSSFRFMLKDFYKGGIFEKTLNEDFDGSLFDETFIVFEIDSIKGAPVKAA